jgi:hypothetical protein
MTELYARIHPMSRYAGQDNGEPFPVRLHEYLNDGYIWQGGPGGQYRHSDLQLFVKDGDELLPIRHVTQTGEDLEVIDMCLAKYTKRAKRGDMHPEFAISWARKLRYQLEQIEELAVANWVEEEDD